MVTLVNRARQAHGDWWETEGRLRVSLGGGASDVEGARLSASGLPAAQWNGADVTGLPVDLEMARRWYAERGVPWGLRVPVGLDLVVGRYVFNLRCMGLEPDEFTPVTPQPDGIVIRPAARTDLDAFAAINAVAFNVDVDLTRAWIAPALGASGWMHWLAAVSGVRVGVATVCRTDLKAGPCAMISGVAVDEAWRRRGIGLTLTSHALVHAFSNGATIAVLNPDTDAAARLYSKLGFREVPGFGVYRMTD